MHALTYLDELYVYQRQKNELKYESWDFWFLIFRCEVLTVDRMETFSFN